MLRREVVIEGCVSVWLGCWFERAGMSGVDLGRGVDVGEGSESEEVVSVVWCYELGGMVRVVGVIVGLV
ncbi:hypothetical protein [Bartonella schoenbuchensis]|uniref:hypothetical protein n=1 Tax=Bartonella schoenbuchensis TaxID=165694 RepID=UPI003144F947